MDDDPMTPDRLSPPPVPSDPFAPPPITSDPFALEAFREREAKQIMKRRAFILHLSVYLSTNLFLIVIWAVTGAGFPWFVFPMFGWGIGLVAHFVAALMLADPHDVVLEREQRRLAGEDW